MYPAFVSRNVNVTVAPDALRAGATTSVTVRAVDGEGNAISAWEGAALDAWLYSFRFVGPGRAPVCDWLDPR